MVIPGPSDPTPPSWTVPTAARPPAGASRTPVVLMVLATVTAGVWAVLATAAVQGGGWLGAEVALSLSQSVPPVLWPILAWINALAVGLPAALVLLLARTFTPALTEVRRAARAWIVAALAAGVLGTVRAVPIAHNEILLGLTALAGAAMATGLWLTARRCPRPAGAVRPRLAGFGLAAGGAALVPWVWAGALGGLTETVLAAAAAAAVGALAANVLDGVRFQRSRASGVLLGGLVAGVALTPIGASIGGTGVNLAEMVVLASSGFAVAALVAADPAGTPGRLPVAALIGVAAFGPLAFVDPEETSLVVGTADVGLWTLAASGLSVAVAWAAGAAYGLILSPRRLLSPWLSAGAAVLVLAGGVGVYAGAGHPGLYGDRLFVILAEQADLSGIAAIPDRSARLRAAYQRLTEHAERTQAPLRESLRRYGLTFTPYYLINAVRVEGGAAVRQWLAQRSDVDRVLLDQRMRPLPVAAPQEHGSAPAPDGSPLWNIEMLGADRAWRDFGATGAGIVIGASDSGVDGGHPDLRAGFRGGVDSWFDPWNATPTPTDHNGHGTHTLGSALGRGGIGVAPQAQWIGCVNLDRNFGSPSLYLDCMQFMLAPFPLGADPARDGRPERAPHILTNSWGCPQIEGCDAGALRPATAALRAAGIFFVAAAGNTGPFCGSLDDPPAPYPDVLTVGAVDRDGVVTEFSSRGPAPDHVVKPDVVAPGASILSAMPGDTYATLDGTSMATPHVAGVVALMWSANPRLIGDIDTTTRILRDTAVPATPSAASPGAADACGDSNVTGAGLVDAYAAVAAAGTA